jgi:DNA polymerase-1
MINVSRRLAKEIPSARLILQVHDELIVECEEKDANAVCSILSEEMENSAKLQVKLTADSNYGTNWLEAKG